MSKDTRIEDEAATWVIRLDNSERPEVVRKEFECWLLADPRHRAAFLDMQKTWRQAGQLRLRRPVDGRIDPGILNSPQKPSRILRWLGLGLAGGLVAAVLFGLQFWPPQAPEQPWETYRTQVGEFRQLNLEDGSVIQMNTDSELWVRFDPQNRSLALKQGEAVFTVMPDRSRPFAVTAASTIVHAVGTEFAVRLRDAEQIELTVTEGQVLVTEARRHRSPATRNMPEAPMISAGHVGLAGPKGVSIRPVEASDLLHRLAWRSGEIVLSGQRLDEAIEEFNRYNVTRLVLSSPELGVLRVGGRFRAADIESFVGALNRAFGIKAETRVEEETILLTR